MNQTENLVLYFPKVTSLLGRSLNCICWWCWEAKFPLLFVCSVFPVKGHIICKVAVWSFVKEAAIVFYSFLTLISSWLTYVSDSRVPVFNSPLRNSYLSEWLANALDSPGWVPAFQKHLLGLMCQEIEKKTPKHWIYLFRFFFSNGIMLRKKTSVGNMQWNI